MTIVYRIHDHEGRGPYKPGFSHKWVEKRDDLNNLLPFYEERKDILMMLKSNYCYGVCCLKKKILRRWITEREYMRLLTYGYFAVKIKVPGIIKISNTQSLIVAKIPIIKLQSTIIKLY